MAKMTTRSPSLLRVLGRAIRDWWDSWVDMTVIMIVWVLAQATIVFGPPVTFGIYAVVDDMVNGQAFGVRGVISSAKQYFWKSWIWGLFNLLAAVVLYVNINFYGAVEQAWAPYLQMFMVLMGYLFFCTQFYAVPYFMELPDHNLFVAMKNGLLTTMATPIFTLMLIILSVVIVALSVVLVLPLFLGLPALIPLFGVHALHDSLVAFGLREREKTPRELEAEEIDRQKLPNLDRDASGSPGDRIANSKR